MVQQSGVDMNIHNTVNVNSVCIIQLANMNHEFSQCHAHSIKSDPNDIISWRPWHPRHNHLPLHNAHATFVLHQSDFGCEIEKRKNNNFICRYVDSFRFQQRLAYAIIFTTHPDR